MPPHTPRERTVLLDPEAKHLLLLEDEPRVPIPQTGEIRVGEAQNHPQDKQADQEEGGGRGGSCPQKEGGGVQVLDELKY